MEQLGFHWTDFHEIWYLYRPNNDCFGINEVKGISMSAFLVPVISVNPNVVQCLSNFEPV